MTVKDFPHRRRLAAEPLDGGAVEPSLGGLVGNGGDEVEMPAQGYEVGADRARVEAGGGLVAGLAHEAGEGLAGPAGVNEG